VKCNLAFGETHIFLGRRYLLTVRHGASLSYQPARHRCEREPEMLALGPSYALYAVLDYVVDNFLPITQAFRGELEELEEAIFHQSFDRRTIQRLYELKKELVTLRLAIAPMQDILNQLMRLHPGMVRDEVRVFFRDVFDHATRVKEACDTMGEMLSAAMSVNLAMVTVGQNEVVKKLAGWAGIIAFPTLIASIYGMNFEKMPELGWTLGYPLALVTMFGVSALLFWRLRKSGWL
jgi:magnesium transporter